jgi:hypothetical protein
MKCSRCGLLSDKVYQCDHTWCKDMCKEYYQEIRWLLTNNEPKNTY